MATTPAQADAALNNARDDVNTARQEDSRARQLLLQAQSRLAGWGSTYGDVSAFIDTYLTQNPDSAFAKLLASKRDALAVERTALKATIDAAVNALNTI